MASAFLLHVTFLILHSLACVPARMLYLYVFSSRADLDAVKSFFGVRREISQRDLPCECSGEFLQVWVEADRRASSLKKSATARLLRQQFERALPVGNQSLIVECG